MKILLTVESKYKVHPCKIWFSVKPCPCIRFLDLAKLDFHLPQSEKCSVKVLIWRVTSIWLKEISERDCISIQRNKCQWINISLEGRLCHPNYCIHPRMWRKVNMSWGTLLWCHWKMVLLWSSKYCQRLLTLKMELNLIALKPAHHRVCKMVTSENIYYYYYYLRCTKCILINSCSFFLKRCLAQKKKLIWWKLAMCQPKVLDTRFMLLIWNVTFLLASYEVKVQFTTFE